MPVFETDLLPIGYLSKAHGIRGELVLVLTVEDVPFAEGQLFLRHRNGGNFRPFTLVKKRRHHQSLLLTLEGVHDRNEAELLRSHAVYVRRDQLPPLDEGEAFLADLPGLAVWVADEDGDKRELGVIEEATAPAGQILWSIRAANGKEILFPAVEEFVLDIDLDSGKVVIAPPPGLLDLYLAE